MKLYKFELSTYKGIKITKKVIEVEEKPKTYKAVNSSWNLRISKKDIGIVSGYCHDTVILLEDDFEKAKEIFAAYMKGKIPLEELKIKCANERIAEFEKRIAEIKKMDKESEE